jgi:flagellar hook-associated protein 1
MTSLSSALSSALSGLIVTSGQSAVLSKNVTRASDENYSRRDVGLTVARDGTARLGTYSRSSDQAIKDRVYSASSQTNGSEVKATALATLSTIIGDPQDGTSVTAGLFKLQQSLRDFQNNPSNTSMAAVAVTEARTLAVRIKTASENISTVRVEAHSGVKTSVEKINTLLGELATVDRAVRTSKPGSEIQLDNLDTRDSLVRQLSQELGVRSVVKSDGGLALYTDSGITLFDITPRSVELRSDGPLSPGASGPLVWIDGVQISGNTSTMALSAGRLAASLSVRDTTTLAYEAQMDEVARSLISLFAETDQNVSPSLPLATGLFTYPGSPTVPPPSIHMPGLAGQLSINLQFEGNPMLLRDGGSNGVSYRYNALGSSGFQQRLEDLADSFDQPFAFAASANLGTSLSVKAFSESSSSTLAADASRANGKWDETKATYQRWNEASLRVSGVNLDEEMAALLSLEKSYQASAKVMTTIDQMFAVLVGMVR